jgi:hypothetical protein
MLRAALEQTLNHIRLADEVVFYADVVDVFRMCRRRVTQPCNLQRGDPDIRHKSRDWRHPHARHIKNRRPFDLRLFPNHSHARGYFGKRGQIASSIE